MGAASGGADHRDKVFDLAVALVRPRQVPKPIAALDGVR
jgi:hypothetical protein